jgi:uncharacterized alkaline shock family protein YloU
LLGWVGRETMVHPGPRGQLTVADQAVAQMAAHAALRVGWLAGLVRPGAALGDAPLPRRHAWRGVRVRAGQGKGLCLTVYALARAGAHVGQLQEAAQAIADRVSQQLGQGSQVRVELRVLGVRTQKDG